MYSARADVREKIKGSNITAILLSMRPRQWTKNMFIFAGIIFSQNLFDLNSFLKVLAGFFIFSFISGCVYIINDINDREEDKKHPVKRYRPIAAGRLSMRQALTTVVLLFLFSITAAFFINRLFGVVTLVYFLLIGFYTFYLKQLVIIDVLTIASGFLLRAVAGVVIVEAFISPWLIVCTVLLALFLALSKRRHEISLLKEDAVSHRSVLEEYSIPFLDQMITIVSSGTIIAYFLYTFSSDKSVYLMATVPFVIYGIFRYLYLIHKHKRGGSPESVLLEDRPLLINIIFWALTAVFILYFT